MKAAFVIGWLVAGVTVVQAAESRGPDPKTRVQHDRETFVTTITIRATDGRVAYSDLLRGLARARGSDDSALEGILPDRSFELSGIPWQLTQTGLNLALSPNVRFQVARAETPRGEPRLVIKLDREALLASQRKFKGLLRNAWSRIVPSQRRFGLEFDDGWERLPATLNLVVFVHGLNSRPEAVQQLANSARREGLPCATFSYPNDQAIAESAALFARQLAQLAREHPRRGVSLVTHSMGGLVSRATIEDPALDPGNVRQLIMVAPPNHGSGLARFSFAIELWDQFDDQRRREDTGKFYGWIEDGLAEASTDLRPDSLFLQKLNARARNPKVRYAIFLGTDGPMTAAELAKLRRNVAEAGNRNRWVRFFGSNADRWLADLDEVVKGKGDGVVSVKRGRLDGVEDTVVLHFDHVNVLGANPQGDVQKLHQGMLKRLKE